MGNISVDIFIAANRDTSCEDSPSFDHQKKDNSAMLVMFDVGSNWTGFANSSRFRLFVDTKRRMERTESFIS